MMDKIIGPENKEPNFRRLFASLLFFVIYNISEFFVQLKKVHGDDGP